METKTAAARNIRLYTFVRIFAKRVFLPLSAIYFVDVSGLTINDLGLLGSYFAAIGLIFEVPSGVFADKYGRATSLRIAAVCNIISTLVYVLVQNKFGVFFGITLEAIGYAFLVGAGEALLHDSLIFLKRDRDYVKVTSRAQSMSLLINTLLVGLVPLTYAIDVRLPFLIGTAVYAILLVVGLLMKDMPKQKATAELDKKKIPISERIAKLKQHKQLAAFAISFGLVGALWVATSDFQNVALKEFGLNPALLGWVFSAGSLLGAILGLYYHKLEKLGPKYYAILDCLLLVVSTALFATGSVWLAIPGVIVGISFWRYRKIIYQDLLLKRFAVSYKATLLSSMNTSISIHRIWLPVVVATAIDVFGMQNGFAVIALGAGVASIPFYITMRKTLSVSP